MKPKKEKIGKRMLNKGYELGKAEAIELGYKNGISEGWDKGKKEAIKQEIGFLEDLTFYQPKDYEGKLLLKEIIERIIFLKSKIEEIATK